LHYIVLLYAPAVDSLSASVCSDTTNSPLYQPNAKFFSRNDCINFERPHAQQAVHPFFLHISQVGYIFIIV
jgi:hypothetical protein